MGKKDQSWKIHFSLRDWLGMQRIIVLNIFILIFALYCSHNLLASQTADPCMTADSTRQSNHPFDDAKTAYFHLRGLAKEETRGYEIGQKLLAGLTFLPRQLIYGIRYTSGYGARLLSDPLWIRQIENVLYFDDKQHLGWYPLVDITSSYRPRVGLNLFVQKQRMEALVRGNFAASDKYMMESLCSIQHRSGKSLWRSTLSFLLEKDDDREFYGVGNHPLIDPRSHFSESRHSESGTFIQTRHKVQWINAVQTPTPLYFLLTAFYQKRVIRDTKSDENLARTFNLDELFGLGSHEMIYQEIAVFYDTRKRDTYTAPGTRFGIYAGYARGINHDPQRLQRWGAEWFSRIPVIQQNRLLIPRIVFDTVSPIGDSPIAFTEYPRHPTFRGVSGRMLLRNDRFSMVPSLEYQWPLSFNLSGHLFIDYLLVSDSLWGFSMVNSPWAIGLGADFHGLESVLATGYMAIGSEGIRFLLTIGLPMLSSERSNWE
ncbi:hypothetical protein GF406_07120 [candidate division KSB1 bacterium]|nr:hypothetical protein [candidate division KSB1 bacterium]